MFLSPLLVAAAAISQPSYNVEQSALEAAVTTQAQLNAREVDYTTDAFTIFFEPVVSTSANGAADVNSTVDGYGFADTLIVHRVLVYVLLEDELVWSVQHLSYPR